MRPRTHDDKAISALVWEVMSSVQEPVHSINGEVLVASSTIKIEAGDRIAVAAKLVELKARIGRRLRAAPILIYHFGTIFENRYDVEICFPIPRRFNPDGFTVKNIPREEALSLVHNGPLETIRESYKSLHDYLRKHGLSGSEYGREVWHNYDPDDPSKNRIEIQALIHNWQSIFAQKTKEVLGGEEGARVIGGLEALSPESSSAARHEWTTGAVRKLDAAATEDQKYEILSCCADKFPVQRIEYLRSVYLRNRSVDEVLEVMEADRHWYARPRREGNQIIETKQPCDPEGHKNAKTDAERRKCACFCSLIRERLEGVPPSYCYCGAGWYRQLWEQVLGVPVRIEIRKSLVRGDDVCQFAIHLPEE